MVTMRNFRNKLTRLLWGTMVGITLPAPVAVMEAQGGIFPCDTEAVDNWVHELKVGEEFEGYRETAIQHLKDLAGM